MKRESWPPTRQHVSELAYMSLSPAHYKAAYTDPRETSAAMRIGTAAHAFALGGARVAVYDGDARRGKAWEAFEEENSDKDVIITAPERDQCMRIVESLMAHPEAGPMIARARKEVALEWSAYGVDCAGRIDGITEDGIFDLKTCSLAEPGVFQRRGLCMHMPAKMAWYLRGAKENKLPHATARLVAVETKPPYAATVFQLTPKALEQGDKSIRIWVERLKVCRASNVWPAYSQAVVDFDVPDEVELTFGAEEIPF